MFIITNDAPGNSELTLKDIKATIRLPGELREAQTNPPHIVGTPVPVRYPGPDGEIGTSDDLNIIMATFSGMAEFLAEGLKEGNHIVEVDFDGTLGGLPSGDVPIKGTAKGSVIVRNPEFSVTFTHPHIVRTGDEYDIYITLTNTSPVTANLVSLTMPDSRLMGVQLMGEETVSFETILPGESKTALYHMLSLTTGEVRASAFEAQGNVTGKFVLSASVGEKGIPLSPDTLVLPGYAYSLPDDIINSGLMLLGEAYSVATTPAGGLPEGLPYVTPDMVKIRVIDFTEAGRRLVYGDEGVKSLQVLALDWQGNVLADLPFDTLKRLTSKGIKFARQLSEAFNEELADKNAVDFHREFAETCSYKAPFFSAQLSFGGGQRRAYLKVLDYYQNELFYNGVELTRDIPFGEMYLMQDTTGSPVDFALTGNISENNFRVEVLGMGDGSGQFTLSLIVPAADGSFKQVLFPDVNCNPGLRGWININPGTSGYELSIDSNGDGQVDQTRAGQVTVISEPPLKLLGAVQDCNVAGNGRAVGLLFNKNVEKNSGRALNNYSSEGKEVKGAFVQSSARIVLVAFDNPISPFIEEKIKVGDVV
ncbi:MAG: hypothetical protein GY940_27080, partial [bacterium]|nr:hypothetical protein [bacterium]